ncbi:MAG TPA: hypothetical protein VIP70_08540 [Nitrososphaeraceae archaeon]
MNYKMSLTRPKAIMSYDYDYYTPPSSSFTTKLDGQGAFPPAQAYHYDDNTDIAREKVLEVADRLFNKLAKDLASDAILTIANYFSKSTSLPSRLPSKLSSLTLPEHQKKLLEVGVSPADDDFGEDEDPDIDRIEESRKSDITD